MNRRQTGEKEGKQYSWRGDRWGVVGKASTQDSGFQGSGWAAMENEKDTMLTAITFGSKFFSYVQSPPPSHMKLWVTLFETLQIKWEVKYFIKKSSCIFLCASFINASLSSCVCLLLCRYDAAWCCRWLYNTRRKTLNSNLLNFTLKLTLCHILLKQRGWYIYITGCGCLHFTDNQSPWKRYDSISSVSSGWIQE